MKVTKVKYRDRIEWKNEKGQWHREDGPAIEYISGKKSWYLNEVRYSKEDWENEVIKFKLKRLSEL